MATRWFPDWLAVQATEKPNHAALVTEGRVWTFAELDADATSVARRLASLGVTHGDRVATLLGNGAFAAVLPHSLLRLGATLVPLNTRLSEKEIDWQIADASPRLVIRDSSRIERAAEADVALRFRHPRNSVLAVIYTSGTTGKPKGAMLTVSNFWWSAMGSAINLGSHADDRWVACLPLFHVGGLSILLRSVIYGSTAIVHEFFDPARVNREIDKGATIVSVVAVMLERMLEQRKDEQYPRTLRCVLVGGGPASTDLLERAGNLGIPVVQTYGLTEACSQVATISPHNVFAKPGSSGKPLYPNSVRIEPPGGEGEILIRGPIVMSGYLNDREATSKTIVGKWLHTGDIGKLDNDGFLYVLDRRDDLIITGGENVYPAEVESVIGSYDGVIEAAVVGLDDSQWGQKVVAVVRASSDIDQDSIDAHCHSMLAGYKVPREFRFVTEPLPRTASGKIRRSATRESIER